MLISVGFIACWAPYSMVSLWSIFRDSSTIPPEVTLLPCMFAKSSTVYNPLIYYIFSQSFKREVKQMRCLCLGFNLCHNPNSINDNNVFMVSTDVKSKLEARSTLQEIAEWKTGILGWKTFFGHAWEERLLCCVKCEKTSGLIICHLTSVNRMYTSTTGVCYYNTTSRVILAFFCVRPWWMRRHVCTIC